MTIEALAGALRPGERLLGLDLGTKTIGLALSDSGRRLASPRGTVQRAKFTRDAQSVLALCVTFSMCAMLVVATVRGDTLYMLLGAALLLLSAAGKAIAAHIYGKQL